MEIVIKIDDERYKDIQRIAEVQLDRGKFQTAEQVIANGIPLPKGHGRLINADVLMEYCQNNINKTVDCNDIARFPTIIKADKDCNESIDKAESEVSDGDSN